MIATDKLPQQQRQRRALSPCIGDAETPEQNSSLALRALAAQQFAALEQEIVPPDQQLIPAALATAFGIADAATYVEKIDPRDDYPAKGYVGRSLNSSIGDRSGCYDVRGRTNFAVEDTSPFTPRQPAQIGEPPLGDGKGARGDRGVKFSSGKGGAFAFPRPSAPTRKSGKHPPSDVAAGDRDGQVQSSKTGVEPAATGDKPRRSFPGEPAMGSGAFMSCTPSARTPADLAAKGASQKSSERGEDGAVNVKPEGDFRPANGPGLASSAPQQGAPPGVARSSAAADKDADAKRETDNKGVALSPRVAPPGRASPPNNAGSGPVGSLPLAGRDSQNAPAGKPALAEEGGGAPMGDRERALERDDVSKKSDSGGGERGPRGATLQEASGQSQQGPSAPVPAGSSGGGGSVAIARPIPITPGVGNPAIVAAVSGGAGSLSGASIGAGGGSAGVGCGAAPPPENKRKRKHMLMGGAEAGRDEDVADDDDEDDGGAAEDEEDEEGRGAECGSDVDDGGEEAGDGSGSEQGAGDGGDDRGSSGRQQGSGGRASKRARLVWTPALHCRFMEAVNHLGLANAVPKTIMQLMNVDGLTRENVASHLQKYRIFKKREAASCKPGWMSPFAKPAVPAPVPMARILPSMPPMYGNMCGMVVPDGRMDNNNHPRLQQHQHMPVPRRPGQDGFLPIAWEARHPHQM